MHKEHYKTPRPEVSTLTGRAPYDGRERVLAAATTNSANTQTDARSYAYDADGSLTSQMINGAQTTWPTTPPTQLTSAGAITYNYDANGNQTAASNGLGLGYNAQDQTTSITPPGQTATMLKYLGVGQNELTSRGATALSNDIIGVAASTNGSATTYYTRDNGGALLDERTPNGTYYYIHDALGSVIGLTDQNGNLANTYHYDPYGRTTSTTGTTPNLFGYDNALNAPAGLIHYGQRYYNPNTSRWTQQDPLKQVTDASQADRNAYAGDNPINFSGPNGDFITEILNYASRRPHAGERFIFSDKLATS